jgi:hypothetical protein
MYFLFLGIFIVLGFLRFSSAKSLEISDKIFSKTPVAIDRKGKIEISSQIGFQVHSFYSIPLYYGVYLAYYLQNKLGFKVLYQQNIVYWKNSDLDALYRVTATESWSPDPATSMLFYLQTVLRFFDGKIAIPGGKVHYFDVGLVSSLGGVRLRNNEIYPAVGWGLNWQHRITQHYLLTLEAHQSMFCIQRNIYAATQTRFLHHTTLSLGLSFLTGFKSKT